MCQIYFVECVSKTEHIRLVIQYAIYGAVCFQFTQFPRDGWENILHCLIIIIKSEVWTTILFRVRSWNNGMRCMSIYTLIRMKMKKGGCNRFPGFTKRVLKVLIFWDICNPRASLRSLELVTTWLSCKLALQIVGEFWGINGQSAKDKIMHIYIEKTLFIPGSAASFLMN